jgi:SAM-dependent methyltransferase
MPPRAHANRQRDDVRFLHDADWYELPTWYDVLHAPGTADEANAVVRIARRHGPPRAREPDTPLTLLEPACGTARHLRHLARKGHGVCGVDLSAPMLDYARPLLDRAAGDRFHALAHADITDMSLLDLPQAGTFDAAFCLVNSLRHLPSDQAMTTHLRTTMDLLAPGGVYAVGLGLTVYGLEPASEDVWRGARGRLSVAQTVQYVPGEGDGSGVAEAERRERVISQLAITTPSRQVFVDHGYDLRRYDATQWSRCIDRAGLRVLAVTDEFGDPRDDWDWRAGGMGYGVFVLGRADDGPRYPRPGPAGSMAGRFD